MGSAPTGRRIETDDKLDTRADFTIAPNTIGGNGPAAASLVLRSVHGFTEGSVDPTNLNDNLWIMERSQNRKDFTVRKKP